MASILNYKAMVDLIANALETITTDYLTNSKINLELFKTLTPDSLLFHKNIINTFLDDDMISFASNRNDIDLLKYILKCDKNGFYDYKRLNRTITDLNKDKEYIQKYALDVIKVLTQSANIAEKFNEVNKVDKVDKSPFPVKSMTNILKLACEYNNIELFKYIISLKQITISNDNHKCLKKIAIDNNNIEIANLIDPMIKKYIQVDKSFDFSKAKYIISSNDVLYSATTVEGLCDAIKDLSDLHQNDVSLVIPIVNNHMLIATDLNGEFEPPPNGLDIYFRIILNTFGMYDISSFVPKDLNEYYRAKYQFGMAKLDLLETFIPGYDHMVRYICVNGCSKEDFEKLDIKW